MASNTGRFRGLKSPTRVAMKMARPNVEADRARLAGKYVYVNLLAESMNRSPRGIEYIAKKHGIKFHLIRGEESGRTANAVTAEDAKRIIDLDVKRVDIISPDELMKG